MPPDPLLRVEGVSKRYPPALDALADISLHVDRGETLGLIGPSGSGKSTLARCLSRVEPPDSGRVCFDGRDLWTAPDRRTLRARIQLIPQQPAASLNPRFTAEEIVSEPLLIQQRGTPADRRRLAAEWMEILGLKPLLDRPAHQFSGGERQRLAIARALILQPALLILDESFTGLDLSVQGRIMRLLRDLCRQSSLACLLITHDLALAASLSDRIAVLDAGRIVESGPAREIATRPQHPRTRQLLDAAMALSLEDPSGGSEVCPA